MFAYNNDHTNSQRLVAYAYCDPHQPGLQAQSKRVRVPLGKKRSVTAKCRHGSKAVSGGFAARVNANADGPFVFASKQDHSHEVEGLGGRERSRHAPVQGVRLLQVLADGRRVGERSGPSPRPSHDCVST